MLVLLTNGKVKAEQLLKAIHHLERVEVNGVVVESGLVKEP
jgi:hypothetical protein